MKFRYFSKLFHSSDYASKLRISPKKFCFIALLCLGLVMGVEAYLFPQKSASFYKEKAASIRMQEAIQLIRSFRAELNIPIDPILDPNATGLIGFEYSDLTTTEGAIIAKRTATNPAFAGLMVKLLHQSGLEKGDKVAVNLSSSFPSLNIALLAACQIMELEPFIISSIGASTYGANIPNFTWLDMEKRLYDIGFFPYQSMAISLGGIVEMDGGIDGMGFVLANETIARHGAPLLEEGDFNVVEQDVLRRKNLFDSKGPIKAFINIGGGLSASGWVPEAAKLDVGYLKKIPMTNDPKRGLIFRYFEEGMPVIHILNIVRLAEHYALPVDPIPLPRAELMTEERFILRYFLCLLILSIWCFVGFIFMYNERPKHTFY